MAESSGRPSRPSQRGLPAHRSRHAGRPLPAPVLAAGLSLGRSRRRPRRHHPHHEPGLHALSRAVRNGPSGRCALPAPRHAAHRPAGSRARRCAASITAGSSRPTDAASSSRPRRMPSARRSRSVPIRCANISVCVFAFLGEGTPPDFQTPSGVRAVRRHGRDRFVQPRMQLLPESRERARHEPYRLRARATTSRSSRASAWAARSTPRNPTGA